MTYTKARSEVPSPTAHVAETRIRDTRSVALHGHASQRASTARWPRLSAVNARVAAAHSTRSIWSSMAAS